MAQSCLRRSGSCLTRLCLLRLDLRYEPELTQLCSSSVYGIIGLVRSFVFATILSRADPEAHCPTRMTALRVFTWPRW